MQRLKCISCVHIRDNGTHERVGFYSRNFDRATNIIVGLKQITL